MPVVLLDLRTEIMQFTWHAMLIHCYPCYDGVEVLAFFWENLVLYASQSQAGHSVHL